MEWVGVMLVLALGGGFEAQQIWQADVRIQTFDVRPIAKGSLSVRIVVASDNDDDARAARLEVLLPIGAAVTRILSPGCRTSPSPIANLAGRVTCELGNIPVRGLREVSLVLSAVSGVGRIGAFVLSDTPDPIPANNFAERAVP